MHDSVCSHTAVSHTIYNTTAASKIFIKKDTKQNLATYFAPMLTWINGNSALIYCLYSQKNTITVEIIVSKQGIK